LYRTKKLSSLIFAVILFVTLIPFSASAESVSEPELGCYDEAMMQQEIDKIMEQDGYGEGQHWKGSGQCYGFTCDVFSKIFGIDVSFSYNDGTEEERNLFVVGTVTEKSEAAELLNKARAGDILCYGYGASNPHSMLVYENIPNQKIKVYDANGTGKPNVVGFYDWTYESLINRIPAQSKRISLFRYTPTDLKLNDDSINLAYGASSQLIAYADTETFEKPQWYSDNTDVAAVNDDGMVHAIGVGTATVMCITGETSARCSVTVRPKYSLNIPAVTMEKSTLFNKQTCTLEVLVNESEQFEGAVQWTSSDPAIASVDKNGVVKAKKAGKVIITASFAVDDTACKRICIVTVE